LNARYEWVQKSTEESALNENIFGDYAVFPVNAFTTGFNYDLFKIQDQNWPQAHKLLSVMQMKSYIICMEKIQWPLKFLSVYMRQ
jgi:hypothetical protein